AQDELNTRTFSSAVDPINHDHDEEERTVVMFPTSTAKLTPQLFAELTGPGSSFGSGRSAPAAAQSSSVTVREVIEAAAQDAVDALIRQPAAENRMLREAAPADRWAAKILAYPCFDGAFRQALVATRLVELPFVLAIEVDSPGEFAVQMLEQFWIFVKAAEFLFTESLGYQMGFARCTKVPRERSAESIAHFQREMAVRALAAPVLSPRSKVQLPTGSSSSATPLLDMENAEKQKWAKRLKAIVDRAGDHAGHNREPDAGGILSAEERARLRLLVFTSGLAFYPITDDLILKYAMELDTRECGPTVVPSLRTALKWVAFRTHIKIPSVETPEIKALEKKIFTERGKPLKEAIPFPIELVQAMEQFVVNPAYAAPARVFIWWVLCMIFASLRFDDAIHVKPHEIE
ncbi:unnamed protein product, partial [Symbiodinium necroappetens]